VDHYLQRARAAAQRDSIVFRTPVHASLERMLRVVRKLKPDFTFIFEPAAADPIFAG
jgi:hypothetical protein